MKQRLLLCLLMLMVSVGVSWATTGKLTLNIKKGNTVTVSATGGTVGYGGWKSQVTVTANRGDDDKAENYIVEVSETVTALSVSGKVIQCSLEDPNNTIKTLSFTGNGDLTHLYVTEATALTKVELGENQLSTLSAPSSCEITGTQTIAVADGDVWATGTAKGFDVLSQLKSKLITFHGDFSNVTFSNWKAVEGTIVAKEYGNQFAFVDGDGYYTSGEVGCTISNGKATVTISRGIKITPASIKLDKIDSPKDMWGTSTGDVNGLPTSAEQGTEISITVTPTTGYELDKFVTTGLVDGELTGTVKKFTVKAKASESNPTVQEAVSIQAIFKGKPQKVTLSKETKGGDFSVIEYAQKEPGSSELTPTPWPAGTLSKDVPYGNKLEIIAAPDEFYKESYTINAEEPTTPNTPFSAKHVATVKVDKNMSIAIKFTPNSINQEYSFALSGTNAQYWSDVFKAISVEEEEVKLVYSSGDNIPVSTDVQFKATPSSITASETVAMKLELNEDMKGKYAIESIMLGETQPLPLTPVATGVYTTAFTAPEEGNASFTIKVSVLKEIEVAFTNKSATNAGQVIKAQTVTYDGSLKSFQYTTTPSNLELDIWYKVAGASDNTYTKDKPIDAGSYAVKYARDAKDGYQAIEETKVTVEGIDYTSDQKGAESVLIIEPADVQIKTVPEVKAVKQEDGTYKYEIGTGEGTALDKTVKGVFEIVAVNGKNGTTTIDVNDLSGIANASVLYESGDAVPGGVNAKAHTVTLRFKVQKDGKEDANYQVAAVVVPVKVGDQELASQTITINPKDVRVDGVSMENAPTITVKVFNGTQELKSGTNKFEVSVTKGSTIKLQAIVADYKTVEFIDADKQYKSTTYIGNNTFEWTLPSVTKDETFGIALKDKLKDIFEITIDEVYSTPYTGDVIPFDNSKITIKKDGSELTGADKDAICKTITYKDASGNLLAGAPKNAGFYTICLDIPMSMEEGYAGYSFVGTGKMQITKKVPTITWPTSVDMIGKGQTLEAATLRGGSAEVQGQFSYVDASIIPKDGENYRIQFVPNDQANYEIAYLEIIDQTTTALDIVVSDKPILAIADVQNGKIIVDNYAKNTQIPAGTKLTIRAIPNEDFEVESITVKGTKTSQTYSGSTVTIEMPDESILVTGSFRVIQPEAPDPEIDPNTQYIVTLPGANDVRGAIINNPGKNGVKFNQPFSFSISTLAADAKNLVVKANGVTLTPTSAGTYRLASVTGNTTVTVSLANPTELKVNIPREYKNAKDYLVGKVQVEGPADGKCYYGDQITLVAYPESGVSFTRWSDGNREQLREMTVTKDLTLKAEFSGTPTGIENIESAGIYAGNGYIQVKNVANADLTVVSISGRIQTRQHLDGDVQVRVPAGVYIVVLENGKDVKRVKVIVR